jgi:hypothetical protein
LKEGGEGRKHAGRKRGRMRQHQKGVREREGCEEQREDEEKRVRVKMLEDSRLTDTVAILAVDQQSDEDTLHWHLGGVRHGALVEEVARALARDDEEAGPFPVRRWHGRGGRCGGGGA